MALAALSDIPSHMKNDALNETRGKTVMDESKKRFQESVNLSRQLMMTTLSHRNPLSEEQNDSSKMAQMMAAVTQAEQSFMVTEKMQELIDVTRETQLLQMGHLAGKDIEVRGNRFALSGKDLAYEMPKDISNALVQIINDKGEVVQQFAADNTPGYHTITFDGRDDANKPLPPGEYRYSIYLVDNEGIGLNTKPKKFSLEPTNIHLGYEIPEGVDQAQILVRNDAGHVVAKLSGEKAKGHHQLTYNGIDEDGKLLDLGSYRFSVEAFDKEGKKMTAPTFVRARVEGSGMSGDTPVLKVAGEDVPIRDYQGIVGSND